MSCTHIFAHTLSYLHKGYLLLLFIYCIVCLFCTYPLQCLTFCQPIRVFITILVGKLVRSGSLPHRLFVFLGPSKSSDCAFGWEQSPDGSRCFRLMFDRKSWRDARSKCRNANAELASFHSRYDSLNMKLLLNTPSFQNAPMQTGNSKLAVTRLLRRTILHLVLTLESSAGKWNVIGRSSSFMLIMPNFCQINKEEVVVVEEEGGGGG